MIIIGLTGSIGMGKSTTANVFRKLGIAVHDSDSVVHRLYEGPDAQLIAQAFPEAVCNGRIDRERLALTVFGDEAARRLLESIVHPLVTTDREQFIRTREAMGDKVVVVDIPLLFETSKEGEVDVIVVVDAPETVQKSRVLSRTGMTDRRFQAILARQTPNAEKAKMAHFVVDTSKGLRFAERQVGGLLRALAGQGDGKGGIARNRS